MNSKAVGFPDPETNPDYGIWTWDGEKWALGDAAAVPLSPNMKAVAAGNVLDGDALVLNSDGTVSVVSETVTEGEEVGASITESAVSESEEPGEISVVYDAMNNKVVVYYWDGVTTYGMARVGTVSENNITFGTPVVFTSNASYKGVSAIYDPVTHKHLIFYVEGDLPNGIVKAVVGTVDGDSISFGTPSVVYEGNATFLASVYDLGTDKCVVAWSDYDNEKFGTACVGTVSDNRITFGAPVQFTSDKQAENIALVYDLAASKVVIFYCHNKQSSATGRANICTVSGSSISFGPHAIFHTPNGGQRVSATYDAGASKTVIFYNDVAQTYKGLSIAGTISNDTITFGTPVDIAIQDERVFQICSTYDSVAKKVIVVYRDHTFNFGRVSAATISENSITYDSDKLLDAKIAYSISTRFNGCVYDPVSDQTIIVYRQDQTGITGAAVYSPIKKPLIKNSNLTSDNFAGFSEGSYGDGEMAKVSVNGSISDQSGLITARNCYVQTDGTVGPVNADVVAGKALSPTKVLVEGSNYG